jgi:hypothetical protein
MAETSCPQPVQYDGRLLASEWNVRDTTLAVAVAMVQQHHYAHGGANTATYLHGLFRNGDDECAGVAWWIPPTKSAALATYPEDWKGVLCLSRLVIVPETPKNAATYLLAGSRRLIDRVRWPCLVTYADEGQGHTGGIYKADNWTLVGKTKPERTYFLGDRMVARKAGPHTRTHAEMLELGCVMVGSFSKYKYVR